MTLAGPDGPATLAMAITKDRLDAYAAARRRDKAADATIHVELAAMSEMFTCAIEAGKLTVAQRLLVGEPLGR